MNYSTTSSRRAFLATAAAAPFARAARKKIPIGLELFSVRDELKQDLMGTVRAVAKLGYDGVEFFSPYFEWTTALAKDVRKLLDDVNMKCWSTHNGTKSFTGDGLKKAIELNSIIGSRYIVMASAGKVTTLEGWKGVAETLTKAADQMKSAGMTPGFHNHETEFKPLEGKRPMEVLAENTPKNVVLQLDVGTCIEAGTDPVAWINANPGRIKSIHCKDWSPEPGKGYRVLTGQGVAPWAKIIDAAESKGRLEFYLIEQEGADTPPMETAGICLATFKKIRGA
jgi:sugar phosphate isomerase/epimerase